MGTPLVVIFGFNCRIIDTTISDCQTLQSSPTLSTSLGVVLNFHWSMSLCISSEFSSGGPRRSRFSSGRNSASCVTRLVKIERQFAIVCTNELPCLREIERIRRHAFFDFHENLISLLVHTQPNVRADKAIKENQIIAEQTTCNRVFVNRTIRNTGVPIDLEQIAFDLFFLNCSCPRVLTNLYAIPSIDK